ncbi:uncharacterized protein ACLA_055210 [Aspergillus clavatus NRRL 1]|uniref:Uncharacterized protein n=1 Tax=Aspergillus clavatus (strain ATCC 1007 / CBS 513.65 / DSM 816 / NCTC 3887 / NRRL 1 / QM 1276 / 107) TaxID=344612 RepID=A1C9F0_ASPCL|nr:uncharacterized protein ACLA_055210 [Aspergillus clavatus NRRL 1]EAW13474.1 hypothetical protein ACLA_055210 [Aspergillus clavatus NRRL 1]
MGMTMWPTALKCAKLLGNLVQTLATQFETAESAHRREHSLSAGAKKDMISAHTGDFRRKGLTVNTTAELRTKLRGLDLPSSASLRTIVLSSYSTWAARTITLKGGRAASAGEGKVKAPASRGGPDDSTASDRHKTAVHHQVYAIDKGMPHGLTLGVSKHFSLPKKPGMPIPAPMSSSLTQIGSGKLAKAHARLSLQSISLRDGSEGTFTIDRTMTRSRLLP